MSETYASKVAAHYAAYRPPLHAKVLGQALHGSESFGDGLDVGCGTGYSALALAKYCLRVNGIDPSPSMLSHAMANERITYLEGSGERMPVPDSSADIVTFAGSLFYAKSQKLVAELRRVCRPQALIVAYDFDVLVDDILQPFDIATDQSGDDYDLAANFSDSTGFVKLAVANGQLHFEATASELAHTLLSNSVRLNAFSDKYHTSDPFPVLKRALGQAKEQHLLTANIYFSKYRLAC